MISTEEKRELYERVVIPTLVYGSKPWSLRAEESREIQVFEMMSFKSICSVRKVDRVKNW